MPFEIDLSLKACLLKFLYEARNQKIGVEILESENITPSSFSQIKYTVALNNSSGNIVRYTKVIDDNDDGRREVLEFIYDIYLVPISLI